MQETIKLRPVKASEWVEFGQGHKELLIRNGAVPTNDVFFDLWGDTSQIKLLRGGRGGGKSEVATDILVNEALESNYFKCYYGRKVFDTVRGSIFATLVASIEKLRLEQYFHYSKANTSSMIITAYNGNTFIPFGADKAEKLKSIKDPTHILAEEFDQFDFEDFKEFYPTLRTAKGKNEFWGLFNAYSVPEQHWILKYFYPELYKGEDRKADFDALEGVTITDRLANFTDNYFIDQKKYASQLKLASGGDDIIYEGLANGAWGVTVNDAPWLFAFSRQTHVKPTLPFYSTFPVYLSFDFNRDPVTCLAVQQSPHKGTKDSFIHFIREFAIEGQLSELCERIKATFPASLLFITGDASGNRGDVGFEERHSTYYKMIRSYLGINDRQLDLNKRNMEHNDSRLLCNTLLHSYPNIYISKEGCPKLINDCVIATVDEDSKKPGMLKKDRDIYKMDLFDAFRYFFQTYYKDYVDRVYLKITKK